MQLVSLSLRFIHPSPKYFSLHSSSSLLIPSILIHICNTWPAKYLFPFEDQDFFILMKSLKIG